MEGVGLPPTDHHFVIDPRIGVGPVHFGMHKEEVSKVFTYNYVSFFKGESCIRSDHCEVVGLIMHYDDHARVEYIEIVKPEHGRVTLELYGTDITNFCVAKMVELLKTESPHFTSDCYGYDFPELGINLFNHDFESLDVSGNDRVECIGVSKRS
jgi:hypothetical protein